MLHSDSFFFSDFHPYPEIVTLRLQPAAQSSDNVPSSPPVTQTITSAPEGQPATVRYDGVVKDNSSVAVVIGIGNYVLLGQIPGCKADATAFADAFQQVRRMNPKRVIESRIKMCANEVKPDGMALVYFSGHAITQDGQALLVPKDCDASNGIAVSWITAQLKGSKARDKVLIVDACHAGAAQKGLLVVERKSFANAEGVAMFLSCNKEENSYPAEGGKTSIYTDVFLHCLQEAATGASAITARSLEKRIEDRMSEWRLQTGKMQTPQLILPGDADVTLVPVGTKQ
jgi:hypothetical protein